MTKFLLLGGTMMLTAAGMAQAAEPTVLPEFYTMGISPNGRYVVSYINETGTLYDVETNEMSDLEGMSTGNGNALTDNGIIVGSDISDMPLIYINGEVTFLEELADTYQTVILNAITNDGSRICGIVLNNGADMMSEDRQMYNPFVIDMDAEGNLGKLTLLPRPEKDFLGRVPQYSSATWISNDGKTILGNMLDYSGFFITPIVYKEDENGEWSYSLPTESLINPEGLELPEDPGEFNVPQVKPEDYMTPEKAAAYNEALDTWQPGTPYPEAGDYMTPEQAAAYNEAVDEYNKLAQEFNDKFYAFSDTMWAIIDSSVGMEQNGFTMDSEGTRFAFASKSEYFDESIFMPVSMYTTYVVDLTDGSISKIDSDIINLIPQQYLADGTMVLSSPAESGSQTYLLLPGEKDYTSLTSFIQEVNPAYSDWMNKNLMAEEEYIIDYDPETGWPISGFREFVITGHALFSADKRIIAGGVPAFMIPTSEYDYLTYIMTDVLSGVSQAIAEDSSLKAYKGGRLTVEGDAADIAVYDLSGRMVFNAAGVQGNVETRLANGIYVVRATANGNTTSLKVRF